jgi:hypothetical protein
LRAYGCCNGGLPTEELSNAFGKHRIAKNASLDTRGWELSNIGFYLASINTAGILGPVDTAQFIGGRIRRDNNPTPGRADVFPPGTEKCAKKLTAES